MENYVPSDQEELIDAQPPFPLPYTGNDMKIMTINQNTKFPHIVTYVTKYFSVSVFAYKLLFRATF